MTTLHVLRCTLWIRGKEHNLDAVKTAEPPIIVIVIPLALGLQAEYSCSSGLLQESTCKSAGPVHWGQWVLMSDATLGIQAHRYTFPLEAHTKFQELT